MPPVAVLLLGLFGLVASSQAQTESPSGVVEFRSLKPAGLHGTITGFRILKIVDGETRMIGLAGESDPQYRLREPAGSHTYQLEAWQARETVTVQVTAGRVTPVRLYLSMPPREHRYLGNSQVVTTVTPHLEVEILPPRPETP
jgi:hypothetical protein